MVLLVVARVVKGKLGGFLHCRVQCHWAGFDNTESNSNRVTSAGRLGRHCLLTMLLILETIGMILKCWYKE